MAHSIIRTPDGPIAVIPAVGTKLLELGHVRQAADGTLHADSREAINRMVGEGEVGVCDFCTAPDPIVAIFETADFEMPGLPGQRSTGGWAGCQACADLVNAGDREGVLTRAIAGSSNPSNPMVAEAIRRLHVEFWKNRKLDDVLIRKPKLSERGVDLAGSLAAVKEFLDGKLRGSSRAHRHERVRELSKRLNVPMAMIQKIADMKDAGELADYVVAMEGRQDELTTAIEQLNAEIDALKAEAGGLPLPAALQLSDALAQARAHQATPTFDRNRPWMEAIEQQYAALADIDAVITRQPFYPDTPADIRDSWKLDRQLLRRAECYTWGVDALAACRSAARTIPHNTVLRADMLPSQAPGWWYFPGPIPVKTTSWDDGMIALLYGWANLSSGGRAMTFTAYVIGREPGKDGGRLRHVPMGSQMWQWEEGHTFHEMIGSVMAGYDADTKAREPFMAKRDAKPMPREDFIRAAAEVSLFFLAACAWMQQRVVSLGSGHIERHRRKQLLRERKLDAPPTDVKIVQLRRVEHDTRPAAPAGTDPVDWSCRWVVNGHWRNQAYGTKHGDRRLIYILPHVKGPDDKPLKQPQHTVYVVNR